VVNAAATVPDAVRLLVMVMAAETVKVKMMLEVPQGFVTVTVTLLEPALVGVPEIKPVDTLIVRPEGRPLADHVTPARRDPV
jgi:uncharacterized ParB-like nuclease family protein